MAQVDSLFVPVKVAEGTGRESFAHGYEGLLQAVRKWQPKPEKADEWLGVMRGSWPFETRYRSAKMMLRMFRLISPGLVAAAASDALGEIIFEVMFFDATHSAKLAEGKAVLMGTRFAEISDFLLPGTSGVYSMAEDLRTDEDLLHSDEDSKVLFAKMAYLDLVPHFEKDEFLNYEIDSFLQLAINDGHSKAFGEAVQRILEEMAKRFPDIVEERVCRLLREYRREVDVNMSVRPWAEIRELIDSYGCAAMWLPRGSMHVRRELLRWRDMFVGGKSAPAKAAAIAASYLAINLLQDGSGEAVLRDVVDESLKVIGRGLFKEPGELVTARDVDDVVTKDRR